MNAQIPQLSHPETFVDLALAELFLVARQEGLTLSSSLQQLQQKQSTTTFRAELVAAETAKKSKCYLEAMDLYNCAIEKARSSRAIEGEALSNELAAKFYLEWGKANLAALYIKEAFNLYRSWGSRAKIKVLKSHHCLVEELTDQQQERDRDFHDELIATLSYEFRTPLNCMLGMTEALQEEVFGPMNERQLNAVSTIERSGGYLSELLDNIVDLAEIQSGGLQLNITDTSILELCQSSLNVVKHNAIRKQIQLSIDLRVTAGNIDVDRDRIHQVLINLLNHAINSTPVGGTVTLAAEQCGDDDSVEAQSWVRFSVVDTSKIVTRVIDEGKNPACGIGQSVGKQYFHQHNSIGLGLVLIKPIVEMHKGFIGYRSEIGRGGCTSIHLPCIRQSSETTATQIDSLKDLAEMSGSLDISSSLSPLILIAEDNELTIDTISSYLTAKGYRTIWALNGYEAIRLARTERPDLVLMDIQMPEMSGIEALRELRSMRELANLPIIALTGLAMDGDRERCLAAGANEYLSKPIKLKQLASMIQQLLVTTSLLAR
jgi:signal transduction histidine kinase/ActR/RegA family two-component response regulator